MDSNAQFGVPPVPEKDKKTTDGIGPPPPYDVQFASVIFHVPTILLLGSADYYCSGYSGTICMDRRNGGINMLFADMSGRKVRLKELWMLKYYPQGKPVADQAQVPLVH